MALKPVNRKFKVEAPNLCTGSIWVGGVVPKRKKEALKYKQLAYCSAPAPFRVTWLGEPKKKVQFPKNHKQWLCPNCLMGLFRDFAGDFCIDNYLF